MNSNQIDFASLKVGDKVYSRMHGHDVVVTKIDNERIDPIQINGDYWFFANGAFAVDGEIMLFPSKPLEFPREMEVQIEHEKLHKTPKFKTVEGIAIWNGELIYCDLEQGKVLQSLFYRELQPTLKITREMLIEKFGTDNFEIV